MILRKLILILFITNKLTGVFTLYLNLKCRDIYLLPTLRLLATFAKNHRIKGSMHKVHLRPK